MDSLILFEITGLLGVMMFSAYLLLGQMKICTQVVYNKSKE